MKRFNLSVLTLILALCAVVFLPATVDANRPATDLPDISAIGNFLGKTTSDGTSFDVQEIEFSFQHYLAPAIKTDIFAAVHKEDGETSFELEEAYVTFTDLIGTLFPNVGANAGIGAIVGKKLLNIGKINPLHPEQRDFVDRPIVIQQFLGGEEGLAGEGGLFNYLLPLPFFSQVEVGFWTVSGDEHEDGDDAHGVEYENRLLNARLWNGVSLSDESELEIGFNFLMGNLTRGSIDDKQTLFGTDVQLVQQLGQNQSLKLKAELYRALYGEDGNPRGRQDGAFTSAYLKVCKDYHVGARYGVLGRHSGEGPVQHQWSLLGTRQLTETSKFRVQYNIGENRTNMLLVQLIFGIGPHAHVLQ